MKILILSVVVVVVLAGLLIAQRLRGRKMTLFPDDLRSSRNRSSILAEGTVAAATGERQIQRDS